MKKVLIAGGLLAVFGTIAAVICRSMRDVNEALDMRDE